ncbi:MAG: arginine--tRNA ligase [Actinomycetota bacterium]
MIDERLSRLILEAVRAASDELAVEKVPDSVELERPPQREFGDFSTNVAFHLTKEARRSPRQVAEAIVRHLSTADFVTSAEVAGAGFINFRVTNDWLYDVLREIVEKAGAYGRGEPTGERVQVEYVSANPSGPLHVGTARNAVLGDALANLLEAAGDSVEREYYFNDANRQMDLFGESVEARYLELFGQQAEIPEGGYQGEYVKDIAADIAEEVGDSLFDSPDRRRRLQEMAVERVFAWIRGTLDRLGAGIDTWMNESILRETGAIDEAVARLKASGHAYEAEGAVFFRSTEFGDEKDRVLIRSNGEPTYFAADCAYVVHKFSRGFDHLVYVWGADHHGTVKRLLGAAQALGYDPARVEIVLYQLVSLHHGGEPMKMSRRAGDFVTLDELLDEVGPDAARYTLLTRSSDTAIDFDIEQVKRQTLDNPVYYVQYAHARIASILRLARERGISLPPVDQAPLERLTHETELELLRKLAAWPGEVRSAAELRGPYRLTKYAEDLAAQFHRFYTDCRVVTDDEPLTHARLWLCAAAKQTVGNVLGIIGVSAPEQMDRIEADEEAS